MICHQYRISALLPQMLFRGIPTCRAQWNLVVEMLILAILTGWTNSSLRKQPTFGDATTGFPAKWHLRNEGRNSTLMMHHYPDLGSAFDWSFGMGNLIQTITGTSQIWVVMRHQNGISALVSQIYGNCSLAPVCLAWENRRHLVRLPLVSPPNKSKHNADKWHFPVTSVCAWWHTHWNLLLVKWN